MSRPSIAESRSRAAWPKKPATYLALQKDTLNLNLRRRIVNDVLTGMSYEGLTAADGPYQAQDSE